MAEAKDSEEVRWFMAKFQNLRQMIDEAPELLEAEAADNDSLEILCIAVCDAALPHFREGAKPSTAILRTGQPCICQFVARLRGSLQSSGDQYLAS